MGMMSRLFGAAEIESNAKLSAAAVEYVGIASPWAEDDSLATLTLNDIFSIDANAIVINRKTAMSIPAIAKARNIIATGIGRMPLVAEKANRPLTTQPACLVQMQANVTNFNTIVWIVDAMIFYGRAFLLITERLANGQPKTFRFVPEWKAETQDGLLVRAFDKPVKADEYVRIDAHHEGLLTYAAEVIRDIKELERTAAEVGANPTPSVILKQVPGSTPLSKDEKTALLAAWSTNRRKRFGSTAYLNAAVEAQVVGQAAENLLIEGRNFAVLQAARSVGVPAYFLDGSVAGSSLTYGNVTAKNRQLVDEALSPYMVAIEQTLSMYLPAGTTVEFDTSVLLRGDIKERMDMYKVAIDAGIYTKDEVRAMENLDPLSNEEGAV
jgi:HK97 family phage portal protein